MSYSRDHKQPHGRTHQPADAREKEYQLPQLPGIHSFLEPDPIPAPRPRGCDLSLYRSNASSAQPTRRFSIATERVQSRSHTHQSLPTSPFESAFYDEINSEPSPTDRRIPALEPPIASPAHWTIFASFPGMLQQHGDWQVRRDSHIPTSDRSARVSQSSRSSKQSSPKRGQAGVGAASICVGEEDIPGVGRCFVYEDGTTCPVTIDGEAVNPRYGVTKAGKARKRLAQACMNCRRKKSKCEPTKDGCVQCHRARIECGGRSEVDRSFLDELS